MDGSVLYTHAGPFPTPSSLPPLSLESNPCFSIINPSWIQDTAGRPFKSSGTSTESRVLVRVTDGLYARPLPMRHGIILKPLLFDRGGGNRWWTREASRTRAAFYSRACLSPYFLSSFSFLFFVRSIPQDPWIISGRIKSPPSIENLRPPCAFRYVCPSSFFPLKFFPSTRVIPLRGEKNVYERNGSEFEIFLSRLRLRACNI